MKIKKLSQFCFKVEWFVGISFKVKLIWISIYEDEKYIIINEMMSLKMFKWKFWSTCLTLHTSLSNFHLPIEHHWTHTHDSFFLWIFFKAFSITRTKSGKTFSTTLAMETSSISSERRTEFTKTDRVQFSTRSQESSFDEMHSNFDESPPRI